MAWFRRNRATRPDRPHREVDQTTAEAAIRLHQRGQRELSEDRFEAAAKTLSEVVALTPDSANSQYLLGVAFFKSGDASAAIEPLRRCVAIRDEHAEAHLLLGVSLGRAEQFDEAEVHLAKAASLGDQQARERLRGLASDFCRECAGPAHLFSGDADDAEADVYVITERAGMVCTACRTVRCASCMSGGGLGVATGLECPDCGGQTEIARRR